MKSVQKSENSPKNEISTDEQNYPRQRAITARVNIGIQGRTQPVRTNPVEPRLHKRLKLAETRLFNV